MFRRTIGVLLLLGLPLQAAPHKLWSHTEMQHHLEESFRHFNDGYFNGTLPPTIVHYGDVPSGEDDIGFSACDVNDDGTAATSCEIWVVPFYNNTANAADLTLAHEICHTVAVGKEDADHGPIWQACMKNLAREDAFERLW